MDLTWMAWVGAVAAVLLLAYIVAALLMLALTIRVARRQDDAPASLDCRDGNHSSCHTCGCSCHA